MTQNFRTLHNSKFKIHCTQKMTFKNNKIHKNMRAIVKKIQNTLCIKIHLSK